MMQTLPPGDPTGEAGPDRATTVIVGGGIAGLAAAYELSRQGVTTIVLDAGPRPGGVILTERVDGFLIDAGPDALLAEKPAALELCRELGLGNRLTPTLLPRRAFILRGDRLHALPEASMMGIPTRFLPLAATGIFSPAGKLRMGLDLVLPRRDAGAADESIGAFMRRRFGDDVVRYLAQPLLAGIHAGDVERLSMRALFPRLVEAEAKHRSLILAFRRMQAARRGGPGDGIFRSLPGGIGEMVEHLVRTLPPGTVRLGAHVTSIEADAQGYRVLLRDGSVEPARAVVVSTPAYATARLLSSLDPVVAARCAEVPYASSVTVALAYRREHVAHPLQGSGFVVPKAERRVQLMAASWVSSKWSGRAPEGYALLRAFVGGARNPELLSRDDRDLAVLAHRELVGLLGISAEPVLSRVYRWTDANAQHEVGHLARLDQIDRRLAALPGLFITGSGFRGTGITDCVADARHTARSVVQYLRGRVRPAPATPARAS